MIGPGQGTRLALAVLLLCTALNFLARGVTDSFAVFLLPLAREFGADRAALTGVYAFFMLAQGVAAPLVGIMFDRLGPRAVYASGLACMGVVYLLAGSASALWQLYLLLGIGAGVAAAACGMIPASALVSRWFEGHLPRAMAVLYAALGFGVLALAPTSQWLIDVYGWRSAYRVIGTGVLVLVPVVALMPWQRMAHGHAGYAARTERRVAAEGAWTLARAWRMPMFWGLFGALFVTSVTTYVVSVQAVAYLVEAGLAPLQAASVFGLAGSMSVFGIVGAGIFAERFGERRVATTTYCCTILGIGALALVPLVPGVAPLALYVLLFGTVSGSRGPLIATLAARHFGGPGLGSIYGGITIGMGCGAALGSWGAGMLHDLTGGYLAGFAVAALGAVAGIFLFRWMAREGRAGTGA